VLSAATTYGDTPPLYDKDKYQHSTKVLGVTHITLKAKSGLSGDPVEFCLSVRRRWWFLLFLSR
jgi:hypothetical protein